jgi:DNA-binding cell septation regulator SpoVG
MKFDSVTVELRMSAKTESNVKAFADVTISLGDDGIVALLGCSVLEIDGRPQRILMPARKGKQTWFDIVELTGKIRSIVEAAVLAEYAKQKTKA